MDKVAMGVVGVHGFDKVEDIWQLKWLTLHQNCNVQSLACKILTSQMASA